MTWAPREVQQRGAEPALTAVTKGHVEARELGILNVEVEAKLVGSAANINVEVHLEAHRTIALSSSLKARRRQGSVVAEGRGCRA